MATLQNIGKLKYRGKDGQWHPLPVVVQDASGGVSTISGKGAPTSATQGKVNQLYRNEYTQRLYICTATDGGGYTWAAVVSDTEDAVTYTAQTLTEEQKTQARANIGAGTSNFSGSYNDLTNKPNIPVATVIDTTLSKSGQAADAKAAGDAIGKKIDAPQVAQVGEVLTVEEVDAEGKPKKWKTAPAAAEQKQADWNQNDETAADYVKNRPGGYYGELVTVDEEIYSGEIEQRDAEILVDWLLVAGKAYKVTIGEEEKTYTAFADSFNGFHGVTIGDATFEEAVGSEEMFALMSVDLEGEKGALIVFPNADVGKTIRVTTETQKREVHKIPTELLDLGGVDESINQTNAALDALYDQHASEISAINNILTVGPISFKRGSTTLKLGDYNANDGLMLRWDYGNGSYTYVYRDGLYVNNVSAGTSIGMNAYTINIVEKAHNSGIRFNLEKTDVNGGTRFSVENVAGVRTTFYASGKIINSNKLLQLSANDTITDAAATTLRGVKTPEQEYDAANKKYVDQRLPSPATAQVGQIVKVKAVDADGKVIAMETVDMPTQKTLKWITVHSSDLTEETTEIVVSADPTGKAIADYNPVGLTLIISTPADATQTDNDGTPWVYPSATKKDNVIRVIGSIAGWKTTARDSVFAFYGGSSAMTCTGNANAQLATYKIDGYALDGVTAMLNGNANHFPVGTHVEVSILCEV